MRQKVSFVAGGKDYLAGGAYVISGPRRAIGQTMPYLFSCLVQLRGSALVSSTMRGETKASGMSRRMWRSTLFTLRAISSNELARPSVRSFIKERARAIAVSNTSVVAGSRFA
jgi:hypothetical protein